MTSPYIFVKDGVTDRPFSVDLSDQLSVGESLFSASVITVSPTSTPPLSYSAVAVSGVSLSGLLSSGHEGTTYGVRVQVTTSTARVFTVVLVVQVVFDVNVAYATRNPEAFGSLVGEIAAGEAVVAHSSFAFPLDFDATSGNVEWAVVDNSGRVHSQGNTFEYRVIPSSFAITVEADALINIPSSTPPTLNGQSYQLRWALLIDGSQPTYAFESLRVTDLHPVSLGAVDGIEMAGDPVSVSITLPRLFESVGYEVYYGNSNVIPLVAVNSPVRTSSGWHYSGVIQDVTSLVANLVPYSISWKYLNSSSPSQVFRETAKLFILNGSILTAIEDCRTQVMKARTTTLGFQDAIFDQATIVSWLRRGRDMFNSAGGLFTHFTMLNASGGVREFWLRYSEVAMLRAQALAEGEKAFDFQGQAISLNVDKAQYYNQLADSLQSQLDNDIRPFKTALKTSNIHGGDGDLDSTRSWNVPRLGIAITPASHLARAPGYRAW
jgi:hypothetical protein